MLRFAHTVYFMCFVWIWEQTAIISLYSINWLVFITEEKCVYWAKVLTHSDAPAQSLSGQTLHLSTAHNLLQVVSQKTATGPVSIIKTTFVREEQTFSLLRRWTGLRLQTASERKAIDGSRSAAVLTDLVELGPARKRKHNVHTRLHDASYRALVDACSLIKYIKFTSLKSFSKICNIRYCYYLINVY
jgi:hypothetical protein